MKKKIFYFNRELFDRGYVNFFTVQNQYFFQKCKIEFTFENNYFISYKMAEKLRENVIELIKVKAFNGAGKS